MFPFVTDAHAQAGAAAPGGFFSGPMAFPVMMGLMFAILYFMVIRPQSNERKKLEQAIAKLQKGDKVITTSGMIATVWSIDDQRAVLKLNDDVKVEFLRSAIASVVTDGKAK